jgi:hypothetical protein
MPDPKTSDIVAQPENGGVASLPWELIAALLGAVSGLSLFLSIIFDMGYFDTVGLRFADVPTTIADHVRSALLWVPQVATAAFVYVLVELMQKQFIGMFVKDGLSPSDRQAVLVLAAGKWVFRGLIGASFLVVFADALTGGQFAKYAAVASTITIAYIVFSGATHMAAKHSLSPTKVILLCLFPVVSTFVYNSGRAKALDDRSDPRIVTITFDGQPEVRLSVYRYLDRGVLGVVGEGKLVFYRWEEVKKVSLAFPVSKRANWSCHSLGIACVKSGTPVAPELEVSR